MKEVFDKRNRSRIPIADTLSEIGRFLKIKNRYILHFQKLNTGTMLESK